LATSTQAYSARFVLCPAPITLSNDIFIYQCGALQFDGSTIIDGYNMMDEDMLRVTFLGGGRGVGWT